MPGLTAPSPAVALVGSYGAVGEPGIAWFTVDESGLHLRGTYDGIENPSFLVPHPGGGHLFSVSETGGGGGGDHGAVHALRVVREGDAVELVAVNHRSTAGDHPCHLAIDTAGRWLAVSNYGTGDVALFPIQPDGGLGEMASMVRHSGTGPRADRQEGPHAHSAVFTPDGGSLIVADLGIDRLVVYGLVADGSLVLHEEVEAVPGSGPRHISFHPDGTHVFVANELDNTLALYRWDERARRLGRLQTAGTLPPGAAASMAADVHVSRSGDLVFVSNRGHDSLAVFAFDPAAGLERIAVRSSGGRGPRGFGLVPGGRHALVANQHSDEIVLLPLGGGGMDIGEPVARAPLARPSCVTFVPG